MNRFRLHRAVACCALIMAWFFACRLLSLEADEANRSGAVEELLAIEPEQSYEDYDDKAEWWSELMIRLSTHFGQVCSKPDAEASLRRLIAAIGDKDLSAIAKLKICLAVSDVMLAQTYEGPLSNVPETTNAEIKQRCRRIKLLACKLQSEAFLKNPALLDSYYRALVFSRAFFGWPHDHHTLLGFHAERVAKGLDADNEDYWWYARNFILLAHATRQDHLLRGAKADQLEERFQEWNVWLQRNFEFLQGHPKEPFWVVVPSAASEVSPRLTEPEYPFANWDEKISPPHPKVISHMEGFIGLDWIPRR